MLWHAYLAPTGCFPDWTDQQLPPPRSLKCWKMMLSVLFFQCIANYMCIAYMGPIKGGRSWKQQKYHRLWKRKRLAVCPQDWTMGFLCLCRRRIFFMFFGPCFFKPGPTSLEQLWWSCSKGQTLGSIHTPLTIMLHADTPTSGVFWRQRATQHQTLLTFFLKENINIWTPPRDLDKL